MWAAFLDWIFWLIQSLYNLCGDWGLAILIITVVFRALITPLVFKQTKSTYGMKKLQPELNRIKERFPDDKVRQNQETQKLYAETKFNPLAGCIPMLIQMPIFIALFQVLRDMGSRVDSGSYEFYNIISDLTMTPSEALNIGFGTFVPYLVLLLIFAFATFIPSILQMNAQDPTQKRTTLIMMGVMSIMMLFIGWTSPGGVLLFWGCSSILAIIQMQSTNAYLKRKDEKEGEEAVYVAKPVEVNVTRKQKTKRPSKKR